MTVFQFQGGDDERGHRNVCKIPQGAHLNHGDWHAAQTVSAHGYLQLQVREVGKDEMFTKIAGRRWIQREVSPPRSPDVCRAALYTARASQEAAAIASPSTPATSSRIWTRPRGFVWIVALYLTPRPDWLVRALWSRPSILIWLLPSLVYKFAFPKATLLQNISSFLCLISFLLLSK